MKKFSYITFLISFLPIVAAGQVNFRTVVPQQPIAVNESFQVQYIIENADNISNFLSPLYPGFRQVTAPNVYSGKLTQGQSHVIRYKNMVVTLAPSKTGRFIIHGATCIINGKLYKSNDISVDVVSKSQAEEFRKTGRLVSEDSPFFLGPGEDPYKKIRENLFLKLVVDKRNCFIGEPVVAEFKLYSRLQSSSDVVKNPGFYGFGVYDMINVNDKVQTGEKLNGHWFDVHTIRKVQLYPLQAGLFTIDAMELANRVEFSRSNVYKKTEQEIIENMYGNSETKDEPDPGTESFEMAVKSEPVNIKVKPLPGRNASDTFAGAVGNFSITASFEKDSILRNEENALTITVRGSGNFQSINAPVIEWPGGLEVFEPSVSDSLDKTRSPLTGKRSFKFVFLSNKPGKFSLPAISFSFFNLKTKNYKTVSIKPQPLFVSHKDKEILIPVPGKSKQFQPSESRVWLWAGAGIIIILTVFFIVRERKKREEAKKAEMERRKAKEAEPVVSVEEILRPVQSSLHEDDKNFYRELSTAIWNYFNLRLHLKGSQMNKAGLSVLFSTKDLQSGLADELIKILQQCEAGVYTAADLDNDKTELLVKTKGLLEKIEKELGV